MNRFMGYPILCGYCKHYNEEHRTCNLTMCYVVKFFGCNQYTPKEMLFNE